MKKLFALVLAVVMICAMSTSVFAETAKVVGNRGNTSTVEDGVTENDFAALDPGIEVSVTATAGNIEHRYAVDIEYDVMSMSVTGTTLIWNVNTLKYETEGNATAAEDKTFNAKIINYSDLPVNLVVAVSDSDNNDGVTVGAYQDNSATALSTGAIKINDATSGTATEYPFDIKVTSDDWAAVANYYASQFTSSGTTEDTMATLTITVAKVPVTP